MSESLDQEKTPEETATPPTYREYDDTIYQHCFESFPIPGLCTNFRTAATLLRLARRELRFELIQDGVQVVEDFYALLRNVEEYTNHRDATSTSTYCDKFIIEIEGLDGSGKTTLCQSLTRQINGIATNTNSTIAIATKTPSACLKKIRPLFDHRGGILARVFYTISNYILEYEIHNMSEEIRVVIVDRWYASTLAYTVAYKSETIDCRGGDGKHVPVPDLQGMEDSVFAWPQDLNMRPNLLLILNIDPEVRRARVARRKGTTSGASLYNPWDDRLDQDLKLGQRILVALSRMHCEGMLVKGVDANKTLEEVVEEAVGIVMPEYEIFTKLNGKSKTRKESESPLEEWMYDAQRLNLCDRDGKRRHHALWNLQVAYLDDVSIASKGEGRAPASMSTPPVIKTVGLDRIEDGFIYYWTSNAGLFASGSSNNIRMASFLWAAGSYPMEFQWRAEGFVTRVTNSECKLRGYYAPNSLVAHMTACHTLSVNCSNNTYNDNDGHRPTRTEAYEGAVEVARESPNDDNASTVCMVRFVPLRIEVLRGGPSTRGIDGYPKRLQWTRNFVDKTSSGEENAGWNMRSILPFTTIISENVPTRSCYKHVGITLALTGCHASGKTTIGRALANILGWRFDPELGEVLREKEDLQPGGHLFGDGSGSSNLKENRDAWDDFIFDAEKSRDEECVDGGYCRITETWHIGNSKWYALRQRNKNNTDSLGDDSDVNIERYKNAVTEHEKSAVAILVHLDIPSPAVMLDRRMQDESARTRLPLKDEVKECEEMYRVLQSNNTVGQAENNSWGIPTLHVNNGGNGSKAMGQTIQTILSFIQEHYYKRAQPV